MVGSGRYRKQYAGIYQIKSKSTVIESITFLKYSGSRLKKFKKSLESLYSESRTQMRGYVKKMATQKWHKKVPRLGTYQQR